MNFLKQKNNLKKAVKMFVFGTALMFLFMEAANAAPPTAPTNLRAWPASTTLINLAWNADTSQSITSFKIEKSTSATGPFSLVATIPQNQGSSISYWESYASPIPANTAYYYRVFSINVDGTSPASNVAKAQMSIPPTPSNLTAAQFSAREVNLTWNTNSENATYIKIERGVSSAGPFTTIYEKTSGYLPYGSAVNYIDQFASDIPSGTTYYYRVYNGNFLGTSTASALAIFVGISPPAAPSGLKVTRAFSNEIDLSWTNNSGNGSFFILERSTNGTSGFSSINKYSESGSEYDYSANTYFPDRKLLPNTTYYYRVKATNVVGSSAYSSVVSQATKTLISPADKSASVLFVITNRGTALPSVAVDYFCNTTDASKAISIINAWEKSEANKFAMPKPFGSISCASSQVTLPSTLYASGTLDQTAAITYLETNAAVPSAIRSAIASATYVAVIHYLPSSTGYVQSNPQGSKHLFHYLFPYPEGTPAATATQFVPDNQLYGARVITHEISHLLGATDKYFTTPAQACTNDPKTSKEYNGYDIMCHRVYTSSSGTYPHPDFSRLVVSEPTAKEIKWIGDVNADGAVNIFDIQQTANVAAGTQTDPAMVFRADVNADGGMPNIFDIQAVANMAANS